nr:serine hydrolase domain-containing protein [Flavobacterium sp. MC2016-06]
MDATMKNSDLPAVVAVAVNRKNQEIVYSHGNAVWTQSTKVTDQNIFRVLSMTKLVTSIAAMQLVEKGLIGLDDSLTLILPEMAKIPILSEGKLRAAKKPITLRNLLTHTSGFGYNVTDKELAVFDTIGLGYKDRPRRFESGTDFLYGTSTYWTGKVVEKVSGMNLETYFRKNITGPLDMERSWFNVPDSLKQYIVSWGTRGIDGQQPITELPGRIPVKDVTDFRGDAGLFSSPHDFSILMKCLLNYGTLNGIQILKKETVIEMSKSQLGPITMKNAGTYFDPAVCCDFRGLNYPDSNFGLAWMIDTKDSPNGPKAGTVSWGGALNTIFYIDFKSGIAASIYTQYLPYLDPQTTNLFTKFSRIIYKVDR